MSKGKSPTKLKQAKDVTMAEEQKTPCEPEPTASPIRELFSDKKPAPMRTKLTSTKPLIIKKDADLKDEEDCANRIEFLNTAMKLQDKKIKELNNH